MEDKINLAALTTQVQKGEKAVKKENSLEAISSEEEIIGASPTMPPESQELEESSSERTTQIETKERKRPLVSPCRIPLSKENIARIDLMRISNENCPSRPEMVNMIIEHYFEERAQKLSVNIQTIIDNL